MAMQQSWNIGTCLIGRESKKRLCTSEYFKSKTNFWSSFLNYNSLIFSYINESLKPYFPFLRVLEGVYSLVKEVFNVQIVGRTDVSVWHKYVRFFDVYDLDWSESEAVGSFYLDPYKLNNKRSPYWDPNIMVSIRSKSDTCGVKPLCAVILENWPPEDNKPSLMKFNEVKDLFTNVMI